MAGFFGFLDYSKPGKGVRKDEPKKPRFLYFFELFFRKFWKLIQLNLLYVLFCIPIVTIGPATAGLTYVLRNFATERPVFLFSDFWDAFRDNWKQSLLSSLFTAAAGTLLWVSWQFYSANAATHTWMYVPVGLCMLMSVLLLFASYYVYLMIVTLDLPLRAIWKNAFLLAVLCLKTNVLTLLFTTLFTIACLLVPLLGVLVFLVIGFAFTGFIICYNSFPGIQKYAIDPYLAQHAPAQTPQAPTVFSDEQPVREEK